MRSIQCGAVALFVLSAFFAHAQEDASPTEVAVVLTRSDSIPQGVELLLTLILKDTFKPLSI